MGYYTEYELNAENAWGLEDKIEESLNNICDYVIELGQRTKGIKWYNHNKHMIELSKLFPEVVFTLECEGEESGDIWKAMYKNGKSKTVRAEIVIPDISEDDLV